MPYPYKGTPDLYSPIKDLKRFLPTKRTEGISTTDMIVRILRDRELYILRSLKRGMKLDELNLHWYEANLYLWRFLSYKTKGNYRKNHSEIIEKLIAYKKAK